VINDLVTDQRVHRMAESLVGEGYAVRLTGRRLRESLPLTDGPLTDGPLMDGPLMNGSLTDGSLTDESLTDGQLTDGPLTEGQLTGGSMTDGSSTDGSLTEVSLAKVPIRTRRFQMFFTTGPLFYAFYNIRLFFYLLFLKRPALLVAVDLDTLPANFLVGRLRAIPLLYDSHEYFTEVPELVGRRRVKRVWERIEGRIVPKIKYAMAVSDSIAEMYTEKYDTPFITVRNVARSYTPEPYPDFHKSYTSKYKIIYQGALNMGRGIELMIDTMAEMDDTVLFVAGDGDIRKRLERRVDELKLNGTIVFTGRLSPGELQRITPQCDLGLSLEEDLGLNYRLALPNKLFDYIQARIPVLCSDLPEMSAIVHRYRIGEVCISREPHQLANQLTGMLKDGDARKRWKSNLKKAAGELCWEREEEKLLSLVRSAVKG
jgi:glycosyltransferase involved in cell wall biosynthesis